MDMWRKRPAFGRNGTKPRTKTESEGQFTAFKIRIGSRRSVFIKAIVVETFFTKTFFVKRHIQQNIVYSYPHKEHGQCRYRRKFNRPVLNQ